MQSSVELSHIRCPRKSDLGSPAGDRRYARRWTHSSRGLSNTRLSLLRTMVDLAQSRTRRTFSSDTRCDATQYTISEHFWASSRSRNLLNDGKLLESLIWRSRLVHELR